MKRLVSLMKKIIIENNYTDISVYKELKNYMVKPWIKYTIVIYDVFVFMAAIFAFSVHFYVYALYFILMIFILYIFYKFLINRNTKIVTNRHIEFMGDKKVIYKLIFNENNFEIFISDKAKVAINYDFLKNIIETEEGYIFITKDLQVVECQKENVKANDASNDFLMLIRDIKFKYKMKG